MCAAFWLVKSFVGVLPSTCIPIRQMLLMLRATPVALVHASLPCNTGEPSLPGVCFGVDCRALVSGSTPCRESSTFMFKLFKQSPTLL